MTTTAYIWTIALAALVTYLTRWPPLLMGRLIRVTPRLKQGLNYIPIGVFAAMVAPAIAWPPATDGNSLPFIAGSAVALIVARLTRSPLWTMIIGVVVVALLRWMGA